MKKGFQPVYFENQRQCAAVLGLDEYELKEWKAQGCPAFRYGRIYHSPLLEWLEKHPPRKSRARHQESNAEIVSADRWTYRRQELFDVLEFLSDAHSDKRIDLVTYARLGDSTVELLIKIGKVWGAGIDAAGWRKTWRAILAEAASRVARENAEKK